MTILGSLRVLGIWDGSKFDKGVGKSTKQLKPFVGMTHQVDKGLQQVGTSLGMITGAGLAVAGLGAAGMGSFAALAESVTQANQELHALSSGLGISEAELLKWHRAAGRAGLSIDHVDDALRELQRRTAEAALDKSGTAFGMFEKLGLDAEDLLALDLPTRMAVITTEIEKLGTAAERAFAYDEIFGGASDSIAGMTDELLKARSVISDEAVQAQAEAMASVSKEWVTIKANATAIKDDLAAIATGPFADFTTAIRETIQGASYLTGIGQDDVSWQYRAFQFRQMVDNQIRRMNAPTVDENNSPVVIEEADIN